MNHMGFNWFDLVFLVVIGVGIAVGRRRGMSSELLDLVQWLLIILVGAMTYSILGREIAGFTWLGLAVSSILAYLSIAVIVVGAFAVIKRLVGEKLVSSDTFGVTEYYLGMIAGAVRFSLILVFGLALFNAPQVTDQQLAQQLRAQNENLGAIYFPPYGSIQRSVFNSSFSGQLIRDHLSAQLIQVGPSDPNRNRDTIWRQREREVNEIVGSRR
jgi:membrane protein required for colicin V production